MESSRHIIIGAARGPTDEEEGGAMPPLSPRVVLQSVNTVNSLEAIAATYASEKLNIVADRYPEEIW